MKVLVIGSKGFIGSHCVSYFTKHGYDVWEADVVVDYVNKKYFVVDVANADYTEIFQQEQFELCINCSGAASVPDSFIHPLRDFFLNTSNVFKMLEAIRRSNLHCKFINLSSAAVYGNPQTLPVKETDQTNPISPYGWHKQQSETLCKEFYALYKIGTVSLRIFSVYGEGLKKQLFWDIYSKTKQANSIDLFGSGEETRDFIYIKDLVKAIEAIYKGSAFEGEVINVASGQETSIKDAATILCDHVRPGIQVNFNGKVKEGDPLYWKADISTLLSYNFNAVYSIQEGLANTAKWLKENN